MDKKSINLIKNTIIFICCFFFGMIISFTCLRIGSILNKTEKFVDNYKVYDSFNKHIIQDTIRDTLQEFTIKGNWVISIDPNNSWLVFRYDPNNLSMEDIK